MTKTATAVERKPPASSTVDDLLTRATLYGVLAQWFARPDEELVDGLRRGAFAAQLAASLAALPASEGLRRAGRRAARALERAVEAGSRTALEEEHTRLFGPGRNIDWPPYETEYTAAHIFMKVQQMADIVGFYRAFGVQMAAQGLERPDHLGAELEFMEWLCLKEAYAAASGDDENAELCREARRRFLADHLGRWVAIFRRQLPDASGAYGPLASLAERLVAWDARTLGVRPRRPRQQPRRQAPPEPFGLSLRPKPFGPCPQESECPLGQGGECGYA